MLLTKIYKVDITKTLLICAWCLTTVKGFAVFLQWSNFIIFVEEIKVKILIESLHVVVM
jgi:hypothetical protein